VIIGNKKLIVKYVFFILMFDLTLKKNINL